MIPFPCVCISSLAADLGVKSLVDVGCGKGVSTSWFVTHGVDTICVEGSHDAVSQSIVPNAKERVVEHDFSRGPWWPERTVDAAWAVEFTEHVGRNYQPNYLTAFRKAALVFVTHSNWGGWHHGKIFALLSGSLGVASVHQSGNSRQRISLTFI